MPLPDQLREAMAHETAALPPRELAAAAAGLTERYRRGDFRQPAIASVADRAAYLAVRLPATFAANERVFRELRLALPQSAPESLLDLGAGPGTAAWAAAEAFPMLRSITLVEAEPALAEMGKRLASQSRITALRDAKWLQGDMRRGLPPGQFDLVVASYAIGELAGAAAAQVIAAAWDRVRQALVVVEPGTQAGFGNVLAAREVLIRAGARLAAPCPHALACPMAAAGDWCHFAQRVERTAEHRRLKQGSLGYEDEKFSYVIGVRQEVAARSRIVRHPLIRPGHIKLSLCTAEGLHQQTIGKSEKEQFRSARKAEWGDRWE